MPPAACGAALPFIAPLMAATRMWKLFQVGSLGLAIIGKNLLHEVSKNSHVGMRPCLPWNRIRGA
jgi:hypothetical protein